jgi:hypothetical protein
MRDYGKILTSIWNSRKFTSLKNDDAKLLYFYLHTCPQVNSVGCFVLKDGYAAADLGWSIERYRSAIEDLSKALLIGLDIGEQVVRIVDYLKHDPFTNGNHAKGAIKLAAALPESPEKILVFQDIAKMPFVEPQAAKDVNESATDSPPIALSGDSPPIALSNGYRTPEPEPLPKKKEEEEEAREAFSENEKVEVQAGFLADLRQVLGISNTVPGPRWGDEVLGEHVRRWMALGLTEAQILTEAKASRERTPEPPNWPTALDKWLASAATGLTAAAAVKPNGKPAEAKGPATPEERLKFYAEWVNNPAKVCPPSTVSTSMARALLDANLVTAETLKKRGISG